MILDPVLRRAHYLKRRGPFTSLGFDIRPTLGAVRVTSEGVSTVGTPDTFFDLLDEAFPIIVRWPTLEIHQALLQLVVTPGCPSAPFFFELQACFRDLLLQLGPSLIVSLWRNFERWAKELALTATDSA
jgi:hypothetical protein